jgi:hypothetical protein
METRTGPKSNSTQPSRRIQIGVCVGLAVLIVALVVYFGGARSPFPREDPNIGKKTDVVIEGTVSCNGQLLKCGYVIAWKGPPVAYGEVQNDGAYRIENAPLGSCILTYSTTRPKSPNEDDNGPLPKELMPPPPDDKDAPPKDKFLPHLPHDKDPAHKGKKPLKDKESLHKMKKDLFGSKGPPALVRLQELNPAERQLVEGASRKYGDPIAKQFELTTKKGTNSKNLDLSIP